MKLLKRETLPGLRTGIIVRTKLASIAQVARRNKEAKFCSLAYLMNKNTLKESFNRLNGSASAGIDKETKESYKKNLDKNLNNLVIKLKKGSFRPQPVKRLYITKVCSNKMRPLGIPTVEDRIAQMVAKLYFEPQVEPIFYEDSYGYRPNKSAIQALEVTRSRCWRKDWVLEFDIKGLFDNIRHDILMEMVKKHTKEEWIVLYTQRCLTTPFQMEDGTIATRTSGTPQGGVISPVIANLFMHYVFDDFMVKEFKSISWARYADDGIAHCVSLKQAKYLLKRLQERFGKYGLQLNLEKTRIVYCKDDDRKGDYPNISFDFLGYTFKPRGAKNKYGKYFTSLLPAVAEKAKKAIRKEVRRWKLQLKVDKDLWDISNMFNKQIQGWINYYTHFYKSEIYGVLRYINGCLVKWVRRKYKKRKHRRRAEHWLGSIALRDRKLFAQWKLGILPTAE